MGESQASGRILEAAEHHILALNLRKKGHTYREIGAQLGVSEQRAWQLVREELDRLTRERTLLADEVRRLEVERLDQMQLGLWLKACKGEVSAVLAVLRIMQRRAKLLGLDAADQLEARLREEIERLARELGLTPEAVLQEAEAILAGRA